MEHSQKWPMELMQFPQSVNFTTTTIINGHRNITENFYSEENHIDNNDWLSSGSVLALVTLYGVVVLGGVFGNASLVITLCSQPSGRLRNPLLVALCLADLMVSGVSAPLTVLALALTHNTWTLPLMGCKIIYFMQSMPVAASTICLLMLSLDRYATVKHPRLAQLRQRRFLPSVLASGAWISAGLLCIPILLAYQIIKPSSTLSSSSLSSSLSSTSSTSSPSSSAAATAAATLSSLSSLSSPPWNIDEFTHKNYKNSSSCVPDYGSTELHISFIILHTLFVFIIPALGVIMNHLGVRQKLCALSLTARAAHGELPLPMPILRRPTHMIIVTGMANAARGVVGNESSDEENNTAERNLMAETRIRASMSPRTPRSIRREQNLQNKLKRPPKVPAPELPLPQTSTLRSRRRLANMLVAAAFIFVGCWAPHVVCLLCIELSATNVCPKTVSEFSLLLGYAHSAVSPILYWTLNYNTLRQSATCTPCSRFTSAQKFLRSHFRANPHPPPSSTNEAALGPFNPRYIKARPQQIYRPPASSHYLY